MKMKSVASICVELWTNAYTTRVRFANQNGKKKTRMNGEKDSTNRLKLCYSYSRCHSIFVSSSGWSAFLYFIFLALLARRKVSILGMALMELYLTNLNPWSAPLVKEMIFVTHCQIGKCFGWNPIDRTDIFTILKVPWIQDSILCHDLIHLFYQAFLWKMSHLLHWFLVLSMFTVFFFPRLLERKKPLVFLLFFPHDFLFRCHFFL